jgi:large subunit ribosomal protein L29
MLKAEELRQLNPDELLEKAQGLRKEHFQLRLAAKTGKLEKSNRLGEVRRDIARVLTIYNEVNRSQAAPASAKPAVSVPKTEKKSPSPLKVEKQEGPKEEKPKKGLFARLRGEKPVPTAKSKSEAKKEKSDTKKTKTKKK